MARVFYCSLCGAPSDKWGTGECLICGVDTISKKMSQFFGREDPSGRPPISKFSVVHNLHWLRDKRGPKRGDIARYRADDLTLCPWIDEMTRHGRMSVAEAMRRLSDLGLVAGQGTPINRTARLRKEYNGWKKASPVERARLKKYAAEQSQKIDLIPRN